MSNMVTEKSLQTEGCDGCHYWRYAGAIQCCHYLLVDGHRRPCGIEDCTVRKPMDQEKARSESRAMQQFIYGGAYGDDQLSA